MRDRRAAALSAPGAAAQAGHLGGDGGLINEDQPRRMSFGVEN
jgi:hypothetical protein